MKKSILFSLIIISIFAWSCGGGKSDKKDADKTTKAEKQIVLNNKDAMMEKLTEYKISVPEKMVFRSVDKQYYLNKEFEQDTSYIIYFDLKKIDQVTKTELEEWYEDQQLVLANDGWNKINFVKDAEMMGGGIYSTCTFVKQSKNCTLTMGISFNDENNCTIHVAPRYEIK